MIINNGDKTILKAPKQTKVGRDGEEPQKASWSAEREEGSDRYPVSAVREGLVWGGRSVSKMLAMSKSQRP